MASTYPPIPEVVTLTAPPVEIPTTVNVAEDADGYSFTFRLSRDEFDALRLFGLHPSVEVDGLIIRRAEGIMKQYAHMYATQCFNKQEPLDCFCPRELFRRYQAQCKPKE